MNTKLKSAKKWITFALAVICVICPFVPWLICDYLAPNFILSQTLKYSFSLIKYSDYSNGILLLTATAGIAAGIVLNIMFIVFTLLKRKNAKKFCALGALITLIFSVLYALAVFILVIALSVTHTESGLVEATLTPLPIVQIIASVLYFISTLIYRQDRL